MPYARQSPRDRDRHSAGGEDWESLRDQLEVLLGQVNDRIDDEDARPARHTSGYAAGHPPAGRRTRVPGPDQRDQNAKGRRDGLGSLLDRADALAAVRMRPASAQRVETGNSAVGGIRARRSAPPPPPQHRQSATASTESRAVLTAIERVAARLDAIEAGFDANTSASRTDQAVSRQISLLTETIERMAAVMTKSSDLSRIEARIDELGSDSDANGHEVVAAKVDELYGAVEKLAAFQVRQSELAEGFREAEKARAGNGFSAELGAQIEESIRALYDRLDALEHTIGPSALEIDRLGAQLSRIAGSLESAGTGTATTGALLDRLDDLAAEIHALAAQSAGHGDLQQQMRVDLESLRKNMEGPDAEALNAIDEKLAGIHERLEDGAGPLAEIGAQLKSFGGRMDRTSDALEMLARRQTTSDHTGTDASEVVAGVADSIAERLDESQLAQQSAWGSLADAVQRIEERLDGLAEAVATSGRQSPSDTPPSGAYPRAAPATDAASVLGEEPTPDAEPASYPAEPGDSSETPVEEHAEADAQEMLRRINAEATEPEAFEPSKPSRETQAEGRVLRVGESVEPVMPQPVPAGTRPAKPKSRLAMEAEALRRETAEAAQGEGQANSHDDAAASRRSFIEAARRAAQRGTPEEPSGSGGLFGRALARLANRNKDVPIKDESGPQPEDAETPVSAEDRPERQSEPAMAVAGDGADQVRFETDDESESFLSRHRRTLLLGASVIAIGLMTLNLIDQQMGLQDRSASPAPIRTSLELSAGEGDAPVPAATQASVRQIERSGSGTSAAQPPAPDLLSGSPGDLSGPNAGAVLSDPGLLLAPGGGPGIDTSLTTASIPPNPAPGAGPSDSAMPMAVIPEGIGSDALISAARTGDPRAQFEVAAILAEGKAVPLDMEGAAAWYERAAAAGFAPAQYRLGTLYEIGTGIAEDPEQARLWYQRAAEAGNRMAMHNLASLHASGTLTDQDFGAAAQWFEQAAVRGVRDSQFNLGMLYARGLGVGQDFAKSYLWFGLAALSGDQDAIKARDDIARSIDPDALKAVEAEIAAWSVVQPDIAANYAPLGAWDETFDPGPAIVESSVVEQVQAVLNGLGYDIGTPDGIMGPRTAEAIRTFEEAAGMSPSGTVNPRLLAVLGSQPV